MKSYGYTFYRTNRIHGWVSIFLLKLDYGLVFLFAGAGYCKFGWSKYDSPSVKVETFVGFGNMQSQLLDRAPQIFATIFSRMNVKPSTQPLILATPVGFCSNAEASKKLREAIFSALIQMKVPARQL